MRTEAAARQLASMEEGLAVDILSKLNAKLAGAILNEMEPTAAARIARRLSLSNVVDEGR